MQKNGNQLSVLPRKTLRHISATQYKAGEVVTREAASRHIPYDAFFHTERYPRKASRCISATQYKAGKVVTGDTASCQKPSGAFLQTKCYPPEQKRTVLEDVGTAYLFYCHLTRDSWTLAFIRRMSQRDWMAFGSTWRFFHMWKHSVKLSTPETDTKQLAKANTPEAGTKQLAKLSTPEQPIITD